MALDAPGMAGMEAATLQTRTWQQGGFRVLTEAQLLRLYGQTPASWAGWRFTETGRQLVSPHGQRFTPERLAGLAWRIEAESRLAAARARREQQVRQSVVTVFRIRNDDWCRQHFGTMAG